MSATSFDNYTELAKKVLATNLEVAGRYGFQEQAQRRILEDVVRKLALVASDKLLEIGCGPGNLLLPLSYWVEQSAGIDNKIALDRLRVRGFDASRISLFEGNFLDMKIPDMLFSKILIYSVIQYMDSIDTSKFFINRAYDLLEPGGKLLLGDLPNSDKKKRWIKSNAGRLANLNWRNKVTETTAHPIDDFPVDNRLVVIDDDFVMRMIAYGRELGAETFLLAQHRDLPFGNTREDVLFVKPA